MSKFTSGLVSMLLIMLFTSPLIAQVNYTAKNVILKVSGSSSIHDWYVQSTTATVTANIIVSHSGVITALSSLNFTTPVAALKGEHNGMDKSMYKALKKDANPNISFVLKTASVIGSTIKCHGNLSIAGSSTETELVVTYKVNADKTITVTGTRSINMIDYAITPPTALFGTIKTSKDVVLSFTITVEEAK